MTPEIRAVDDVLARLEEQIGGLYSPEELREQARMAAAIERLKRERGAVILGHNYMAPPVYLTVPDFTGDSFALCQRAAETGADPIVFCGVKFMAETAKIINPERTVLAPSLAAGCSLAESITAADVRELRRRYPGVPVVTYINTYADVKAECDICCTSGNAARIVESLQAETVIFLPDEYLARNVARETGRHIIVAGREAAAGARDTEIEHGLIGWGGRCEVHEKFTLDDLTELRRRSPDALILAHPECSPAVVEAADFAGSTKAMIEEVQAGDAPRYILLTESAMGDNVQALMPGKTIVRISGKRCPHMEEITLEQTLAALQQNRHQITVPEDVRRRARRAVDRMLALG